MRLDGAYDDLEKIADTPIVAGGRNLKLSDVATVRRGYEDPPTFLIRNQGEPALVLSVVMQEGWNGLDLGKALETGSQDDFRAVCRSASPSARSPTRRSILPRPSTSSCSSSSSPSAW